MSYTPSLETQLADLRESWRNLVHQRDEQGERIATLEQQMAAMQAQCEMWRKLANKRAKLLMAVRRRLEV